MQAAAVGKREEGEVTHVLDSSSRESGRSSEREESLSTAPQLSVERGNLGVVGEVS